jgi:hypothetical protein
VYKELSELKKERERASHKRWYKKHREHCIAYSKLYSKQHYVRHTKVSIRLLRHRGNSQYDELQEKKAFHYNLDFDIDGTSLAHVLF